MPSSTRAVIWIDHAQARMIQFDDESSVTHVSAVLVTGPANAKAELMKHFAQHDPALVKKISAIQTVDHPTDGELLDRARRHFGLIDRGLVR